MLRPQFGTVRSSFYCTVSSHNASFLLCSTPSLSLRNRGIRAHRGGLRVQIANYHDSTIMAVRFFTLLSHYLRIMLFPHLFIRSLTFAQCCSNRLGEINCCSEEMNFLVRLRKELSEKDRVPGTETRECSWTSCLSRPCSRQWEGTGAVFISSSIRLLTLSFLPYALCFINSLFSLFLAPPLLGLNQAFVLLSF